MLCSEAATYVMKCYGLAHGAAFLLKHAKKQSLGTFELIFCSSQLLPHIILFTLQGLGPSMKRENCLGILFLLGISLLALLRQLLLQALHLGVHQADPMNKVSLRPGSLSNSLQSSFISRRSYDNYRIGVGVYTLKYAIVRSA